MKQRYLKFLAKPAVLIATVAVIAGVGGFLVMLNVASSKKNSTASTLCEATACVNLLQQGADPLSISVPIGSFVQFNSSDGSKYSLGLGANHSVTNSGAQHDMHAASGAFSSGDFGEGEAWRVQFKDRGTYLFTDKYNEKVTVLVVAYEPGGDYKIK